MSDELFVLALCVAALVVWGLVWARLWQWTIGQIEGAFRRHQAKKGLTESEIDERWRALMAETDGKPWHHYMPEELADDE